MLVDEAEITVIGGKGGDGIVSFFPGGRRTAVAGGDGGNGGSIYAMANTSLTHLNRFSEKKEFKADNGEKGVGFTRTGKAGADIILYLPIGTTIIDQETGRSTELKTDGEKVLLVKGGVGGRGNTHFVTATTHNPNKSEPGTEGETRQLKLIMRFIAQFGFIGHPNAGKSSLLNELTAANVKTASYAFTTLEPNLGALEDKIIADIPGLIEGASQGKGLGIKFLKHIEKVELLFHCITVESKDVERDYKVVRQELESYNPELTKKEEIILLTKIDLAEKDEIKEKIKILKKFKKKVLPISIHDWDSLEKLKKIILK